MTVDDLIDLEILIREMVGSLENEIADHEANEVPPGKLDGTEGRLSRQDSLQRHEIAKDAQRRRQQKLIHLNEALSRMDDGTYGKCVNCGEEIDVERLKVLPEAMVCGDCSS